MSEKPVSRFEQTILDARNSKLPKLVFTEKLPRYWGGKDNPTPKKPKG